jgi:hypothetical protein
MVCDYTVGQSEYVDSIKWYKDSLEFYRIVPNTPIERDRVVTFARPGIKLDKEKSGVSELTGDARGGNACFLPWGQDCQIFLDTMYKNGGKYTKCP